MLNSSWFFIEEKHYVQLDMATTQLESFYMAGWNHLTTRHIDQKIGILIGQSQYDPEKDQLTLDNLITNLVSPSAIENESLNVHSLRSSLANHLGVSLDQPYPSSDRSEELANIMPDALNHFVQGLSIERLLQWHQWLFNEPDWTMQCIRIEPLHDHKPMQVVSGWIDRPTVHFECTTTGRTRKWTGYF